jgi:hypothetical protein
MSTQSPCLSSTTSSGTRIIDRKLKGEAIVSLYANGGEEALELARKLQPDAIARRAYAKTDGWAVLGAQSRSRGLRYQL